MGGATNCSRCDAEIPADQLWGLCTRCLYSESTQASSAEIEGQRLFGNYQLEEVLGRGGMGVVYKALQRSPRRTVAVKMILDAELASERSRRRFTLEAELAAKLDHPNIVPIYEVGENEGQPFLSMKFVCGETLRKKIETGELSISATAGVGRTDYRDRQRTIVQLLIALSRAVKHAHEHGVLHRDLKPGNIIVDDEGRAHLTDFGLAKLLVPDSEQTPPAGDTLPGTPVGTPGYMSPEQAQGLRLSAASDIYGLGAILYEMLTGKAPFRAGTPLETLRLVLEQEPKDPRQLNPRVHKDLATICLKCLEKSPSRRYASAGELADDLERWLRQEPIHARPAGPGLRAARWVARNRIGTGLILSLCAGLVVAVVLLKQALDQKRTQELRSANSLERTRRAVEEMWNEVGRGYVPIDSSSLADLANLTPREPDAMAMRLTFGKTINSDPIHQALEYAPFLHQLERRVERILKRPVVIDLRFYKTEEVAIREVLREKATILRMDPVLYVLSNAPAPRMVPIARELSRKDAVIFASNESGITNLSQAVGKRLVFGQENSAVTFWAKVHLRRAGLRATDFQSLRYIEGGEKGRDGEKLESDQDPNVQANKQAIQQVASGKADVGVALSRQFDLKRHRKGGLRPLASFPVPSDIYVANSELEAEVFRALQQVVVSFHGTEEKDLLARLSENARIEGFAAISEQEFEEVRTALNAEIPAFDGDPGRK